MVIKGIIRNEPLNSTSSKMIYLHFSDKVKLPFKKFEASLLVSGRKKFESISNHILKLVPLKDNKILIFIKSMDGNLILGFK